MSNGENVLSSHIWKLYSVPSGLSRTALDFSVFICVCCDWYFLLSIFLIIEMTSHKSHRVKYRCIS